MTDNLYVEGAAPMTIPSDRLRDKRPRFLRVFDTEYNHFKTIPKSGRADAMAVYMCLAHHSNSKTETAFPSYATIADHCGLSKPTAIKAINTLEAAGFILVESRSRKGERISNLYTLLTVVVKEIDHPDVVVNAVDDVVNLTDHVVNDAAQVVNEVDMNHTEEPDPPNKMKERESPPVSLRSTSPKGERAPSFSNGVRMTTPPDEVTRMLKEALGR